MTGLHGKYCHDYSPQIVKIWGIEDGRLILESRSICTDKLKNEQLNVPRDRICLSNLDSGEKTCQKQIPDGLLTGRLNEVPMHHFPSLSASLHHNQPLFSGASHTLVSCISILRMWSSVSIHDLSNHFAFDGLMVPLWSGLPAPEICNSDTSQPQGIDQQNDLTWLWGNWAE